MKYPGKFREILSDTFITFSFAEFWPKYYVYGWTYIYLFFRYLAYHAVGLFIGKLNYNPLILLLLYYESLMLFTLVPWFELSSKMGQHWIERPVSSQQCAHNVDRWHHLIFADCSLFGCCIPRRMRETQTSVIYI